MIPPVITESVEHWLSKVQPGHHKIISVSPVSGGSINRTFTIRTTSAGYFIKFNDARRYPGMFEAESRGLAIIRKTACIEVPDVFLCAQAGTFSFLLMEEETGGGNHSHFWEDFGRRLACLHRVNGGYFGLDHDNYIGSLNQQNNPCDQWTDFLAAQRLRPMVAMARRSGLLNSHDCNSFDRLLQRLKDLIPSESPSLLHGDLWNGNFIMGKNGYVCLIDPAVYYGHREMDIAMTRLFGGFDSRFYAAYNEAFPLAYGWEERISLNQLFPLLVHVNLFGGGYVSDVRQVLRQYL